MSLVKLLGGLKLATLPTLHASPLIILRPSTLDDDGVL